MASRVDQWSVWVVMPHKHTGNRWYFHRTSEKGTLIAEADTSVLKALIHSKRGNGVKVSPLHYSFLAVRREPSLS